ncbi:MAG: penicillin-insensitive murein endopeptidase [Hyphomicrobiales bacterium]|nr:penicillin-insensitive murein endopeptidase [Hyphomicrobiales bacterium]
MRRLSLIAALVAACPLITPAPALAEAKSAPKAAAKSQPPAKELFGAVTQPAPLAARAIGGYARGCLAGARALPVNGPAWQAMRLSRNRNWGHPALVKYVETLARDAREKDGWPGLLVGDMAQPAGGPMRTGHASHQIGLDADIWLKPMPPRELTREERETLSADSMLGDDKLTINAKLWTPQHVRLLRRAALYPQVARIFVHPVIKRALCEAAGEDRGWLGKVRPWWGHHYHFHVRLTCPADSAGCVNQPPLSGDDGCGAELDNWFKLLTRPPAPPDPNRKPPKPKPPLTLADLPADCARLLGVAAATAPTPDVEEQPEDTPGE